MQMLPCHDRQPRVAQQDQGLSRSRERIRMRGDEVRTPTVKSNVGLSTKSFETRCLKGVSLLFFNVFRLFFTCFHRLSSSFEGFKAAAP